LQQAKSLRTNARIAERTFHKSAFTARTFSEIVDPVNVGTLLAFAASDI
jgi:hypothetical protein